MRRGVSGCCCLAAAAAVLLPAAPVMAAELPPAAGVEEPALPAPEPSADEAPDGGPAEATAPRTPAREPAPRRAAVRKAQASGDDTPELQAAGDDRDCPDFSTQPEAQDYFEDQGGDETNNVDNLDADGDGIACEDLPSGSAPTGGVDTGFGGTADLAARRTDGPGGFIAFGGAIGLALGLVAGLARRPLRD